jgi:hypothetical protein
MKMLLKMIAKRDKQRGEKELWQRGKRLINPP